MIRPTDRVWFACDDPESAWIEDQRRQMRPRLNCVYCGAPIRGRPRRWAKPETVFASMLACTAHRHLVPRDPEYGGTP